MIEFIENEPWCRYNGELTTPEWCINHHGLDGEPEFYDNHIFYNDTLYTDNSSFYNLLTIFGEYHKVKEYDYIANKGYGSTQNMIEKSLIGDNGAYIVCDPTCYKDTIIKPYNQFYIDYPNFNKEKYDEFMNALDNYYNEQR